MFRCSVSHWRSGTGDVVYNFVYWTKAECAGFVYKRSLMCSTADDRATVRHTSRRELQWFLALTVVYDIVKAKRCIRGCVDYNVLRQIMTFGHPQEELIFR